MVAASTACLSMITHSSIVHLVNADLGAFKVYVSPSRDTNNTSWHYIRTQSITDGIQHGHARELIESRQLCQYRQGLLVAIARLTPKLASATCTGDNVHRRTGQLNSPHPSIFAVSTPGYAA